MILLLVGPTAVGKSELAIELAERIPAEIVVADSMQVYRGMDVGTGKPSMEVRRRIPHHGLDLVEPEEEFDVARYCKEVSPVIRQIEHRGKIPVIVGGCGLYVRWLFHGLCTAPGQDPALRERLYQQAREEGPGGLHAQLRAVDPEAAQRIHPNDVKKLIRALEVFRLTGKPITVWQRETTQTRLKDRQTLWIGLTCARDLLYRRIETRIESWLSSGWLEEARALHRRALSRTARLALGYRELYDYLEGKIDWPTTVGFILRNTRRYAKRQWTWFKAEPQIRWLETDGRSPRQLGKTLLGWLRFPLSQVPAAPDTSSIACLSAPSS